MSCDHKDYSWATTWIYHSYRKMNFVMFTIGVLVCLPSVLLGMVLSEEIPVLVNFCCQDGETLRIRSVRDRLRADCVRRRDLENSLEGKEVPVLGRQNCEIVQKKLSKIGTKKPDCGRGLMIAPLDFQESCKYFMLYKIITYK